MSYNIKAGEVAFVRYTDEPIYVSAIEGPVVTARRAVQGSEGLYYEAETFDISELISEKARIVHGMELQKFQAEQRERYSDEFEKTQKAKKAAAAAPLPMVPSPDATGYSN